MTVGTSRERVPPATNRAALQRLRDALKAETAKRVVVESELSVVRSSVAVGVCQADLTRTANIRLLRKFDLFARKSQTRLKRATSLSSK